MNIIVCIVQIKLRMLFLIHYDLFMRYIINGAAKLVLHFKAIIKTLVQFNSANRID